MQFTELAQPASAAPMSFPLRLADGTTIATIGDAGSFIAALAEEQRGNGHWRIAARMLDIAIREPSYLKAATMSLQAALLLDARIERIDLPAEQ